jgi:hypothetical protein
MDRVRVRAMARAAASEARKWEQRRRACLERAFENSERLRQVAESMMAVPVIEETLEPDGTTKLRPVGRWVTRDATVFLRTSIEMQAAVFDAVDLSLEGLAEDEIRAIAGLQDHIDPDTP